MRRFFAAIRRLFGGSAILDENKAAASAFAVEVFQAIQASDRTPRWLYIRAVRKLVEKVWGEP